VDPCLYIVELGLECTQLVVGLLGLESPLLAALGEVGHLVLELLEGDLEGLMLALPKVPALAEEPNQRARSAPAVLGCPLWSPSRRLAGKGSVHACLLLPHPWEHPKLAPAQQKKQNLARSNWQSRSTFHGARATLVHPDLKVVIPLAPEPIIQQDGQTKNDCERNSTRRWLKRFRQEHPHLPVIVVEDALSANAPHLRDLREARALHHWRQAGR